MAYDRLLNQEQKDEFGIIKYKESNKLSTITGFEMSKYIAAQNNVVFFHTDVRNAFLGKKEASIIIPYNISDIQKGELKRLIEILKSEGFALYLGKASFVKKKSLKTKYERLKLENM